MRIAAVVAHARSTGAAALIVLVATATACSGADAIPTAATGSDGRPVPAPRPTSIDDGSPEGAVRGFIASEAAEAYDLSYGLLSRAGSEQAGSLEDWIAGHVDQWPVAGGELEEARTEGDRATVPARMRYHSSLDESRGLVPARARAEWVAVNEDGHWRIAPADVRIEAEQPSDDDADDRVVEWARSRQACEAGDQYEGGLVGVPVLADRLCRQDGDLTAGPATELDSIEADRFVASFGPGALNWARVVPLTSPAGALRAVVAPIGDRWTVVGVLEPARAG